MDQHLFELASLRAAERLIGMSLGGLTIFLGYKLFMNISQATESSAEADFSGKVRIVLTRIGPGVFFALFGTLIVGTSYLSPVQVADGPSIYDSLSVRPVSPTAVKPGMSYVGATGYLTESEDDYEKRASTVRRSIRALHLAMDHSAVQDLVQLRPAVQESKLALLRGIWRPEWGRFGNFSVWADNGGGQLSPLDSLSIPAEMYNLKEP